MAKTKISWADFTFNHVIGCSKVHDGCTKCYAEAFAKRTNKAKWGPNGTRVKTSPKYWGEPLKWNKQAEKDGVRRRVFCASLADVFEDWHGPILHHGGDQLFWFEGDRVPRKSGAGLTPMTMNDVRRDLFELIDKTLWLDWLLLTKRPENIERFWPTRTIDGGFAGSTFLAHRPNVWLGTSISNQETADVMVPRLLACRDLVPVLFLSAEPLLGPIDVVPYIGGRSYRCRCGFHRTENELLFRGGDEWQCDECMEMCKIGGTVDQVIFGVESRGKYVGRLGAFESAEAFNDSVAAGVAECKRAGVAAFVKQIPLGGLVSHDPSEWPEVLRVQELPTVEHAAPAHVG